MKALQRALTVIYPHQCLLCDAMVEVAGGLCPCCWADVPFNTGHSCDLCAAPLIGESDGFADFCDACMTTQRPWKRGRAALLYSGAGRRLVLGLKHGDRTEFVRPAARWMARAGREVLSEGSLLVPIPIHWSRRLRRRYNQSADLARALAKLTACTVAPDALFRTRATSRQEQMSVDERILNQANSMQVNAAWLEELEGRDIVLIDDVMTSGATLGFAAETLAQAGVSGISCLVLARAIPRP